MLGGGQLGRMSILAGRAMGYRFHVFEPTPGGAAAMVADAETNAEYADADALTRFAQQCDVVTLEFENVAREATKLIEVEGIPVRPRGEVLHLCQNRQREKEFLRGEGLPCVDFRVVYDAEELAAAVAELGTPCVLKTAAFGYDGKGQAKFDRADADFAAIWAELDCPAGVLEAWAPFERECSVVVARSVHGQCDTFPVVENIHRHHILHQSIAPARIAPETLAMAAELATTIAGKLEVIGLLTVELFVMEDGSLLVNELAPRPHNSGHYSIDACQTSQFEQHIRAVCGLPLGNPQLLRPAVMVNLLGDLWLDNTAPDWSALLEDPDVKLHLYDKGEPRSGRKMGHFTVLKDSRTDALATAEKLYAHISLD